MLDIVKSRGQTEAQRNLILTLCNTDGNCSFYRQQLCIPKNAELRKRILFEVHDSLLSRHLGYVKTLNAVRKSYFWAGMKRDVLNYVRSCLNCQKIKAESVRLPGKLEPLDIPEMKWECISMDFIT